MDEGRIEEYLKEFIKYDINPSLDRIKKLLLLLGNPQDRIKVLHVGGTNGKGSVCAMLASILQEAGMRVGLFTSPHFHRVNERFCINGEKITDSHLLSLLKKVLPHALSMSPRPTYFELTTAVAFLYFLEQRVDYAVMEVGMGGVWDATNVCSPTLTAITNVELEHKEVLGKTKEEIAYQKAGIIKKGVPILTAEEEVFEIIESVAKERGAPFYRLGKHIKIMGEDEPYFVEFEGERFGPIQTSLKGHYQRKNAALAIALSFLLGIKHECIKKGLLKTRWVGRSHFLSQKPLIVLDGAHNPAAAQALVEALKPFCKDRTFVVVGIMREKDILGIFRELLSLPNPFFLCATVATDRAASAQHLFDCIKGKVPAKRFQTVSEAIRFAHSNLDEDDTLLVCGSLYTVAEALSFYGLSV